MEGCVSTRRGAATMSTGEQTIYVPQSVSKPTSASASTESAVSAVCTTTISATCFTFGHSQSLRRRRCRPGAAGPRPQMAMYTSVLRDLGMENSTSRQAGIWAIRPHCLCLRCMNIICTLATRRGLTRCGLVSILGRGESEDNPFAFWLRTG